MDDAKLDALGQTIVSALPGAAIGHSVAFNQLAVDVEVSKIVEVVKYLRDDPNCHVILMSYGAGSVGLNLQFASYVFLFDRWWNPAVEDQAINRAHRIGAKQAVTVTRFLALNTIEQRINEVLERKRELFDAVFNDSNDSPTSRFSREEIFSLFNLKAA